MIQICHIDYLEAAAADNMAMDAAMLEFGRKNHQVWWRFYGWKEDSMTFGYSQKWRDVQAMVQGFKGSLVRRLTGGGIVDHRNDLTYALTLPPDHGFYRKQALEIYRELHQGIAEILINRGIAAELAPCGRACGEESAQSANSFCFPSAEPYDVIQAGTGSKIAGAAMKRSQSGILVQGSLDKDRLGAISAESFMADFERFLAKWLDLEPVQSGGSLPGEIIQREQERFASREWNERR
ncbi:MAG: hypothetical protein AB3N64_09410 [Puniceicoccaceae bacterium]